ncbi:MAG: hypothetical protein M1840_002942 [Geoglossum simile]|nr:MAG: hypothetical protein M1840_002942 [Geoglossum simile]
MEPLPTENLCSFCSEITIESIFDHGHQPSIEALQRSSGTCPLCQLIYEAIEPSLDVQTIDSGRKTPREANLPIVLQGQSTREVASALTDKQWRWQNIRISMVAGSARPQLGEISPYVREDDPLALAGHILGRSVSYDPGSERTLQLAVSLINRCNNTHRECWRPPTEDPSQLPKRVIDVCPGGSKSRVRLHDSVVRSGEYTCLSHCWGTVDLVKTTPENQEKMKAGFALDTLPKTYRDAINITRGLSIRYIWIDSLCILQGPAPNPDWEEESLKMGAIFQNSFCTIAAAAAENSLGGCFAARTPPSQIVALRCQYRKDRQVGTVYFRSAFQNWRQGPLDKRAWTLQESILSIRVLHFREDQMMVECSQGITGENGHQYESTNTVRTLPLLSHFTGGHTVNIKEHRRRLHSAWSRTINNFTMRNLTYETDKLPAIAGLANEIQRLTGDKYLTGLWKSCLSRQLLWYGVGLSKPSTPRAPSWSWAALNGKTIYSKVLIHQAWGEHESEIQLLSTPTKATGNPGRLHLAGKLVAASISTNIRLGKINLHDLVTEDGQSIGFAILDTPQGLPLTCQALLVSAHCKPKASTSLNNLNVLLLGRKTTDPGLNYVRIGVGFVCPRLGVFADRPVDEVHII